MIKLLITVLCLVLSGFGQKTKVDTYTYADSLTASSEYAVCADGREVFVLPSEEPHIASFGCNGKVKVEIESLDKKISSVAIRPLSKHYEYKIRGNKIILSLHPKDRISVEINGNMTSPLFVFANPLENKQVCTKHFRAGQIYNLDSLVLRSGDRVLIEGGAIVRSRIMAKNANDIEISGGGIIDSRFISHKAKGIQFERCNNVRLSDAVLLNKEWWGCVLILCDNVHLDNFKSISVSSSIPYGIENDAFDLLGCQNVDLKHCFGYAHDDNYCIKARKWNWGREVKNIRFEDCIAWNVNAGNSFEVGYEAAEPISDVHYRNIYSIHSGTRGVFRRGAVSIHNGGNAAISNLRYENVYIEDPKEYAIHIAIVESTYNIGNGVKWTGGTISDVVFKNVNILHPAPQGSVIMGYNSEHNVSDITFDNLLIDGRKAGSLKEADFRTAEFCNDILFK